jgi:acyl-CoA hydrolase
MDTTMKFENHKVIKPEDLNHYGFLFGGKLLLWVDEFSWIAASLEFPTHSFVTKGMDKVEFKKSVRQGTILAFNIEKSKQGRAYIQYEVNVFIKNDPPNKKEPIFNTVVTFVSVDERGKIKPLT